MLIKVVYLPLRVLSVVGFLGIIGLFLVPQETHAGIRSGHVWVNPEEVIGPVRREIFGVHVPAWNETIFQYGIPNPRLLDRMKQAGFQFLVYPGGLYGYDFVWNKTNLPAEMDTDEFLSLAEELGATIKITVNPSESPELAADWVDYVNVQRGAGVQYWEIGDEPYSMMSATEFIDKVRTFVPVMKAVDPGIKIVANVSVLKPAFTRRVIREVGELIDVYSIHFFPLPPSQKIWAGSPYTEVTKEDFFSELLHSPADLSTQLVTLRRWVGEAYPEREIEYHVGSFAPVWWGPEDWTVNSLPAALWTADLLGIFAREQLQGAATWALINPYPPGQGDFGIFSPEMKPYARYYPYVLYTQHFGQLMVESRTDVEGLSVHASLSEDGQNLYLMLINKSPDENVRATFDLGSFQPRGDAAVWILDGPVIAEHPYLYGLRKESLKGIASEFQWIVPSYSVVALEIPSAGSGLRLDGVPNLALDKVATASSVALCTEPKYYKTWDFIPDRAIDGDLTTRWASKIFARGVEWFQVDLGRALEFNEIVLHWEYWATEYTVAVSDDGQTWREIADRSRAEVVREPPQPIERIALETPVNARYIRITMTERPAESGVKAGCSTWTPEAFSLWEFEVYLR